MTAANQAPIKELSSAEELAVVFKFLTPDEVHELTDYLEYREYSPGTVVIKEGELGEYMGFLAGGKLEIKKETNFPGKFVIVAILDRGTMVGEMAVVEKLPRSATVMVKEEAKLLILTTEKMEQLIAEKPQLGIKILKRILHILSLRLRSLDDRLSWLL